MSRRRRRSALSAVFTPLLLVPVLACVAQPDAGTGDEPALASAVAEAAPPNGAVVAAALTVPETEAGRVLAAALKEAKGTDRLLFVHSGADW